MEAWLQIIIAAIGGGVVAALVGLGRHIVKDIETRKEVEALKKRVSRLDGINGH